MKTVFSVLMSLFMFSSVYTANIVSVAGGGIRVIRETKDYYKDVTGYRDSVLTSHANGSTFPVRIHCKFFRYNATPRQIPLMVQFVEWGGTIDDRERSAQNEDMMNDPFMTVVIMPERDGAVYNTANWYWGNIYTENGVRRSIPWAHNAVIEILNDLKAGRLDSCLMGNTIDTNRIYGQGTSIGGTATAQICLKHPEIFAACHSHAGWTRYYGDDNGFFNRQGAGCASFAYLTGGIPACGWTCCHFDSSVLIAANADQLYLPAGPSYIASYYTDLNWYFNKSGDSWNYRDPSFPTPFIFHTTGSYDNPLSQGDNLQPAMDASRRGSMYHRVRDGHSAGGAFIRWNWMRNFRKNQSYLAFSNRDYDDFSRYGDTLSIGYMNDLSRHGWDPATIVDEPAHYYVKLTGSGTADVTLQRLQSLIHPPGTQYDVSIDGVSTGSITADEYGLVTIPQVRDSSSIELNVLSSKIQSKIGKVSQMADFSLSPNPCNPSVSIALATIKGSSGTISIYDMRGTLIKIFAFSGSQRVLVWNATDFNNAPVVSGVYLVRLQTVNACVVKKLTLLQ